MTASDFGVAGAQAYITQTGSAPLSNTISTSITFTPNYSYIGTSGGVVDLTFLSLATANSGVNENLVNFTLDLNSYVNQATLLVSNAVQFDGGSTTGTNSILLSGGIDGANLTLTMNDTMTTINTSGNTYQIQNAVTILNGTTTLGSFNFTTTGNAANAGSYDPINNPLTLLTGVTPIGRDDYPNFLNSGANVNITSVTVQAGAVPEPYTWAMMLGGLGLLTFLHRRARRA